MHNARVMGALQNWHDKMGDPAYLWKLFRRNLRSYMPSYLKKVFQSSLS